MNELSTREELEELYFELGQLPVCQTNKSGTVNWTGLTGVALDYVRERKANKFLDTPVGDTNYLNVPGFLLKRAKTMSRVFNDTRLGGSEETAEDIVKLINDCYDRWVNNCPGIENALIDDELGKGVALPLGIVTKYYLNQAFQSYPLSDETRNKINKDYDFLKWRVNRLLEKNSNNSSSTGCLGALIFLLVSCCFIFGAALFITDLQLH